VLARAEGLVLAYGGVTALAGVDIDVRAGEIVGLVGANGAGKTTLLDCLSGHARPPRGARGRVFLAGTEVTHLGPDRRARRGIIRSFQEARLFPTMGVWDTLLLAQERHTRSRTAVSLLGGPPWWAGERVRAAAAGDLAARLGLAPLLDKLVGELSTGQRRVLDLACCIALAPRLLLLDEPSAGLSSAEAAAIGPLLTRVGQETGAGMVVVEHDLPLVWAVADRVLVLEQGRVVGSGRPEEVAGHAAVAFGRLD
jgi:ABC-type branched-subunit amino acid transport system ATPase component